MGFTIALLRRLWFHRYQNLTIAHPTATIKIFSSNECKEINGQAFLSKLGFPRLSPHFRAMGGNLRSPIFKFQLQRKFSIAETCVLFVLTNKNNGSLSLESLFKDGRPSYFCSHKQYTYSRKSLILNFHLS